MRRHIHIASGKKKTGVDFRELWHYRDLVLLLTRKTFVLTYKQTVLGPAWLIFQPLLSGIVYMFVFGRIVGVSTDGVPQLLFYLCGNSLWTLFAFCLTSNASTFTANAHLFGKVYFPRLAVPLSNMFVGLLRFAVQLAFLLCVLVWYAARGAVTPSYGMLWLFPLLLLEMSLMGCAVGLVISSLTTTYRVLSVLVGFGLQLWRYVSPVVSPIGQLKGKAALAAALRINPMTAPLELSRRILFGVGEADPLSAACSLVFTAVCLTAGITIFNRVEKNFMDTV